MILSSSQGAHSVQVEMRLIFNGSSIGITHMGRDFVRLESCGHHPPGDATILLRVDQSESRWTVRLPNGNSADSRRVAVAKVQ
jgi:hypothetical protein